VASDGPSYSDFCWEADRIRSGLQVYHEIHGRYPDAVEEAGILLPPSNRYGSWRYKPAPDGHGFQLSVGEPGDDKWVMSHWGN
jgi:hypothetical protein